MTPDVMVDWLASIPLADMIRYCRVDKATARLCHDKSDTIYRKRLANEFPAWGIIGIPKDHYIKLVTNKGTHLYVLIQYLQGSEIDPIVSASVFRDWPVVPPFTDTTYHVSIPVLLPGNSPSPGTTFYMATGYATQSTGWPTAQLAQQWIKNYWPKHWDIARSTPTHAIFDDGSYVYPTPGEETATFVNRQIDRLDGIVLHEVNIYEVGNQWQFTLLALPMPK